MDEQPRPQEEMPKSIAERIRERPMLWGAIAAGVVLVVGLSLSYALQGAPAGDDGFADAERSDGDIAGDSSSPGNDAGDGSAGDGEADRDASDGEDESEGDPAEDSKGSSISSGDGDTDADAVSDFTRAPKLAYRLDGDLYVAAEDGTGAVRVAESAMGFWSLSPDAKWLAYVDAAAETLHIAMVGGGDREIGPAADSRLSWSPDSQTLAYARSDSGRFEVHTVRADGSAGRSIGPGHSPEISRDGKSIAFIGSGVPGQVGNVVLAGIDGSNAGGVGIKASEIVWGGDGLIFTSSSAEPGEERLYTALADGSSARELVGAAKEEKPVMYASLCTSPDGKRLAFAAHGDDGFSRAYVVETLDPSPVALSVRRDTYPQCWSSESDRVFFIEGNAFQGEQTSLMGAMPNGLGRVTIVEGAGL